MREALRQERREHALKRFTFSIAGLALISALTTCGDSSTTSASDTGASAPSLRSTSSHKAEISDYALSPYTADQYPTLFAAFGSRIEDVERLPRAPAVIKMTESVK